MQGHSFLWWASWVDGVAVAATTTAGVRIINDNKAFTGITL